MALSSDDKKYITRFIKLNQPCSLKKLINAFCTPQSHFQPTDVITYIAEMNYQGHFICSPDLFNCNFIELNEEYGSFLFNDLIDGKLDATIVIKDYVSYVWKRWNIKGSI